MVQVRNIPKPVAGASGQPHRMRFGKFDRIILADGIDWRCEDTDEFGHVLRAAHDKKVRRAISHAEMRAEAGKGTFQHDRDWYSKKAAKQRLRTDVSTMRELPYLERQLIMWKESLIIEVEQLKESEPEFVSYGDKKLPQALQRAQASVIDQNSKVLDNGKRKYFGRLKNIPQEPPCMRSFLEWKKVYLASARDPLSLRSGKYRSGRYDERMSGEQLDLLAEYSRKWLTLNKPPKLGVYDLMKAHIENTLNPARKKPIAVPSLGRFMKELDDLDAIETVAGREGVDMARRLFQSYADGKKDVERALQEVEIDHWNVGLITILKKARIWHRLNRASRRRLEKVRMVLGAAICRRTHCVVGMILSRTPSVEAALRLIEMTVSNKRRFAEAAGCKTPYDIFGIPESIWFDGGPAFNNSEVRSVLRDMKIDWDIAPGGLPHMRAMVERLFGMIDAQAISWFEGRTFSNVVEKGDYDPGKRTDTSVEELGRVLVRYVVDRHHNKPRKYLGGETPREAHLNLSEKYPIWGAPGADHLRNYFGFDIKRKLERGGIRFLNIRYRSADLHKLFMKRGSHTIMCRVHLANLVAISAKIGKNKLLTVRGPKEFDRVDAETWIAAEAAIRAKMKTTEKTITGPIINAAILDIARMADDARRRAGIDDSPLPRSAVLALEKRMRVFADFPEDREDEPASNQDIYATAIKTGRGAPDPNDDEPDDVEENDLPKATSRRTASTPARGGRRAHTPSKRTRRAARKSPKTGPKAGTKPVAKPSRKPAPKTAPAPKPKRPTGVQRRPGLKRTFTARD